MSKTAAGTKETALRAMREGTAANVDKAALKKAATAKPGKAKKKKRKGY